MRVAIIGGTGFVGSYLTEALLSSSYSVSLLVRQDSKNKVPQHEQVSIVNGDIVDTESIRRLLQACDVVIYNVGILREVPRKGITYESTQYEGLVNTVDAAVATGVQRFLLMSANGAKIPGTQYQETKRRAEEYALKSGLDVTVFRPSVIFGDPHGAMEFATQLLNQMVRPPIPAVRFFSGFDPKKDAVVMSPVHIKDVVRVFLASLENQECVGKTYILGGPEVLSWTEMISRIAAAKGCRKWFLPMPVALMRIVARLFDWLPFFPVTRDQLTMLEEGNVADSEIMQALTGREATTFSIDHLNYLGK